MPTSSRDLAHPDTAGIELTAVLFALSDPVRLAIVRELAAGERDEALCAAVAEGMPKSTRSNHLKTLREAGVISNLPEGRHRRLRLRREDLDVRFPGLVASVLDADHPARGNRPGRQPAGAS